MPTAYETALADRYDAGLVDDPDDTAEAREGAAQRRAHALLDES
jgi:hypothetical protein